MVQRHSRAVILGVAEVMPINMGTVYYPLACPSGDRIKEENRVYFSTEEESQNAGYKQSARCN